MIASTLGVGVTNTNPSVHWPTTEWLSANPEDHDVDSKYFDAALEFIDRDNLPISSLIVMKDGYAVLEWYQAFCNENYTLDTFSVTKSVIGFLIGIAIDKGYIESIDTPITEYFNSSSWGNPDPRKESITIRYLLTMTAGYDYDELSRTYFDPENSFKQWRASDDWVQYALDLPLVSDPGTNFTFNSGCSHLLSAIITITTGQKAKDFAKEYLFEQIGIEIADWPGGRGVGSYSDGSNGIRMTPRDMARFGYLVLNKGTWNGTQIVPEQWVKESTSTQVTSTQINASEEFGYGYQFWILPQNLYGKGASKTGTGQDNVFMTIIPEYGLVVVFTSYYGDGGPSGVALPNRKIITDYIIPAVAGEAPNSIPGHTGALAATGLSILVFVRKRKR